MQQTKQWIVYKHQNLINQKIYIGITSQAPEERWKNGNGYKLHCYFYRAILKYGWDNFSHEILYKNLSYNEACEKEKELIQQFQSNISEYGYNLTKGGEGISGYSHSNKTKEKISNTMKQKDYSKQIARLSQWNKEHRLEHSEMLRERWKDPKFKQEMTKKHKKKVLCVNTGQIFESINDAAQYGGISPTGVSKCLKGVQKSAGKHPITKEKLFWKYV